MTVVVISGPAAAVSVADAKAAGVFTDDDSDDAVSAMLAAAQGTIDGPDGWLGRAVGLQTLEATWPAYGPVNGTWPCGDLRRPLRLPYSPIRKILSVTGGAGSALLDPATYAFSAGSLTFSAAPDWAHPVTVRYQAGYGVVDGQTLATPAPIKHAIMLMAKRLMVSSGARGAIASETVDGVGSTTYATARNAEELMDGASERLLSTFRIFA